MCWYFIQRSARSIFQLSRREREFLIFNLAHRDENENFCHLISCFETRPRIISFNLKHRDEIEIYFFQSQTTRREREFFNLFSVFETRTRIFNIAISPREIRFCPTFLHANLVKFFYRTQVYLGCRESPCNTLCTLLFQSIARQECGF